VLELELEARRGGFALQVECRLAAEWTVVFGPSGAGKSTLLRLLAGLDRNRAGATANGRVVFDGDVLTDTARGVWVRPGKRRSALVTQQPALFPHLSVESNVGFGLRHLDGAARAKRVAEMLELVGAPELASRRPRELSGGQTQRIALARALAPAPRLLLLDEPFSALDGAASDAMLDGLQGWLRRNRVQAVMATHDVSDALATGSEALLLRQGRMAALGPAREVLASERNRLMERLESH